MLVVGRKPGQYVVINEKIVVAVIKSEDGNLRLAIEAPKDVPIVRGELLDQAAQGIDHASYSRTLHHDLLPSAAVTP